MLHIRVERAQFRHSTCLRPHRRQNDKASNIGSKHKKLGSQENVARYHESAPRREQTDCRTQNHVHSSHARLELKERDKIGLANTCWPSQCDTNSGHFNPPLPPQKRSFLYWELGAGGRASKITPIMLWVLMVTEASLTNMYVRLWLARKPSLTESRETK